MSNTKIVLDRQASAQTFAFGTTSAAGEALVTLNKGTQATSFVSLDVKGSQNIGGDLNLTGNLNITGSINETSVTNLAVADLTIRVNKGGTTAGAAGSGLQVEGDSAALIGAITFATGSATKFQIGDGTTQADIVSVSATQTLTNKTIGGGQISGNITGNAANVTGTVAVGNGGTGAATLTGVVIGNGTSAFTTVTAPSGAIVGTTDTQTLSGKTLTTPKIAQINDATNNKSVILTTANSAAVNQLTFNASQTAVAPSIQATGTDTNVDLNLLGQGTGLVKVGGVEVVTISGTQTLTNKTIAGTQISGNIAGNAANVTGTVAVANGGTGATTLTGVLIGNGTGAVTTVTAPSGAIVGTTDTQTLSAKTLTTPKIGQINDPTNNLAVLINVAPASSVNQITHTSAIATANPSISATGSDTNISLNLVSKGTGVIQANGLEVVTISGTQTLTNKSIVASQITGTLGVPNGGTGAATLTGVVIGNGTGAFTTVTAPSGAIVGTTDTQTLTNKTLTTPKITQINDVTNNFAVIITSAPASSVNQLSFAASITTAAPSISATGTDTNISFNLIPKGSGVVQAGGLEVVTISGTQTLTNKTIAGTQISGNISGNAGNVTGTVLVANGGTGLATLTLNNVMLGNGTGTPLFVAPGGNGNVLTSNGTTWTSAAAGAPSQYQRATAVSGTMDGSNKIFAIANTVLSGSEIITQNGQTLTPGSSNDYILSGTTLTFQAAFAAPVSTDVLRAYGTF